MTAESVRMPTGAVSRTVFAAIGIACYLRLMLGADKVFLMHGILPADRPALPHEMFLTALTAAFVVGILLHRRLDKAYAHSMGPSVASMLICIGGCVLYMAFQPPIADSLGIVSLSAGVFAIGMAGSFFAWGWMLSHLEQRTALIATLLSLACYGLLNIAGFAALVVGSPLLNLATSILMLVCWLVCGKGDSATRRPKDLGGVRDLPLATLAIFVLGVLACAVTAGLLALDVQDHGGLPDIVASILVPLLISAGLIVGFKSVESDEGFRTVLTAFSILLILVALLATVAFMAVDSTSHMPATMMRIARCLCIVCCLCVLGQSMHRKAFSFTGLFGWLGLLAYVLPSWIERYLLPTLNQTTEVQLTDYEAVIVVAIAAVLMVAALASLVREYLHVLTKGRGVREPLGGVSMPSTEPESEEKRAVIDNEGSFDGESDGRVSGDSESAGPSLHKEGTQAYEAIASQYGLTPREKEVMTLLAEGNTMKKVASVLRISLGTVQSHSKSIYRKLNVHSRQELVDLVHDWRSGMASGSAGANDGNSGR